MSKTTDESVTGVHAIFFDLDDTLFDRQSAQRQIVNLIVSRFSWLFGDIDQSCVVKSFFDAEAVAQQEWKAGVPVETTRRNRSRRFLAGFGLDQRHADSITSAYLRYYPDVQIPVLGARALVEQLAPRFPLGIISNGSPDVQYRKLDGLGIKHLFQCILLSEEIGLRKPDRGIFARAAQELGKAPGECMHVGDSHDTDVIGAKGAGFWACWFNRHGAELGANEVRPDFEIHALSELTRVLDASEC